MTTPDLAKLVRQHAETSRLMGVDFVPRFRTDGSGVHVTDQTDSPRILNADAKAEPAPTPTPGRTTLLQPAVAAAPKPKDVVVHGPASDPVIEKSSVAIEAKPSRIAIGPKSFDRSVSQKRLDALRAKYETDAPHQHFNMQFTNIVWGDGDPCARLMFVGEAPGADEDRTGKPFVGRAGELLNKMITAMGLKREDIYIANVLKTRPPDNATPTPKEVELCAPYLWEQITIIAPEVIVTLGLPASRCLLQSTESMGQLRGTWASFTGTDGRSIPVMPTYHPAFLLRSYTPENRGKVWSDLQMAMERLGSTSPG